MRASLILALTTAMTLPALADGTVSTVIPNRPGVPIIINGIDASWSVIEGDWGLARGIHVQPTIYGGRYIDPEPAVGHYFPSNGTTPGYGRVEIETPRRKPAQQAESYFRSWGAESDPPRGRAADEEPPLVIETQPPATPNMVPAPVQPRPEFNR